MTPYHETADDNYRAQVNVPAYVRGLHPLDAVAFLSKTFEPTEQMLAPFLPTQGLCMIHAPRGTGKTHVAMGIACAVATATSFLSRWSAPKPRRVLFIDGEMPAALLQKRFAETLTELNASPPPDYFNIVAADIEPDGLPDLADLKSQQYFDPVVGNADLIVLDNLSTICRSMRENEADAFEPVLAWLLAMRRAGKSVLLIHHSGKAGGQRGSSRKEDILDSVIGLRRPPGYSADQGARFEVHYEKTRRFHGEDAEPFEAWLKPTGWTTGPITQANDSLDTLKTLRSEGLSIRDIGQRTGMSKSQVHRKMKDLF
jgi:putative DNA primase/helicase